MDRSKHNIEDVYPLSPMQQGMLFHTLHAPHSGVYFKQASCVIRANLNVSAFRRAWQRVVDRHPIMRTAFLWKRREKPLQVVRQQVRLPWDQQDLRELSPLAQEEHLERYLQADQERGVELSRAPLMHLALIRLAEDAYHFILSFHHLLLDGWSMSLVLKEVFAFYEVFCQDQDLQLEEIRPYRDYIAWLQQQDLSKAEIFWRETLKGFSAPTPLGVDRVPDRPSDQDQRYEMQQVRLPGATTSALRSLAQQHQLTLNVLVQGAWALLLSRYGREEDIIFGVTVAGRPADLAGIESMVGLFINTLPVRVRVPPEAWLVPWLQDLQVQQLERQPYEYSPLVHVQGWSGVPRGLPLFASIFVFENYPRDASLRERSKQLEIYYIPSPERTNYPLAVLTAPGPELLLQITYDGHRFDAATIGRMLGHFQALLEGMAANPKRRLLDLPLLTETELQQLLVEWNDTQTAYPQDQCLPQLFEAQVEQTPDEVALVCEDAQLTYRELNRRANQLAHHLRKLGVGPERLVGLCMERSLEMVVGLLGILKAGGVYVPLDPAYPPERIAFMLADAQVSVLVTQERLVQGLPEHAVCLVCLDSGWETIAQESAANPAVGVQPDNLAYVIYTSGSTGQPKGVLVAHRGLYNVSEAQIRAFEVKPGSRVLQFASISFDACIFEILMALRVGGTLCVGAGDPPLAGPELIRLLRRLRITITTLPPSALAALPAEELPELRVVTVAGEVCPGDLVARWAPGRRFFNLYGPTEATIWTTIAECTDGSQRPPIGRPIANTQIYLLDEQLQPVAVGVPGELYIGGVGLARGYLNRPELTAERFLPHPFSQEPGARVYRTGDLARYRSDGNIEFLGRMDDQVKVRGFRIELGEIEAVLSQHPAVRDSVVVVREDAPGDSRLVAYVVANQPPGPSHSDLRRFLQAKLPDYMLPAAFVALDALPLTPNGKVDRRTLPAPDQARPMLEEALVPPRTPVEEVLAGIWAEILRLERVGIQENFFELGGHSLLATQVIARVREAFQVELPLRRVFEAPTVADLAQYVEAVRWAAPDRPPPPGAAADREEEAL